MGWKEIRAKWQADPEFRSAFDQEYPYAGVANAVAELRASHGLTQQEFADLAGTSQSVVARLESGRHPVNTSLLNRIAGALGMSWRPVFGPSEYGAATVTEFVWDRQFEFVDQRVPNYVYVTEASFEDVLFQFGGSASFPEPEVTYFGEVPSPWTLQRLHELRQLTRAS